MKKNQIIYLEPRRTYQIYDSDGFAVCWRETGSFVVDCTLCLEGKVIFKTFPENHQRRDSKNNKIQSKKPHPLVRL